MASTWGDMVNQSSYSTKIMEINTSTETLRSHRCFPPSIPWLVMVLGCVGWIHESHSTEVQVWWHLSGSFEKTLERRRPEGPPGGKFFGTGMAKAAGKIFFKMCFSLFISFISFIGQICRMEIRFQRISQQYWAILRGMIPVHIFHICFTSHQSQQRITCSQLTNLWRFSVSQIAAGVQRLYQGLFPWAIFQAPLSRFGDVAANDMVLVLMGAFLPQAESWDFEGLCCCSHSWIFEFVWWHLYMHSVHTGICPGASVYRSEVFGFESLLLCMKSAMPIYALPMHVLLQIIPRICEEIDQISSPVTGQIMKIPCHHLAGGLKAESQSDLSD